MLNPFTGKGLPVSCQLSVVSASWVAQSLERQIDASFLRMRTAINAKVPTDHWQLATDVKRLDSYIDAHARFLKIAGAENGASTAM
jgi:hypothetical protein